MEERERKKKRKEEAVMIITRKQTDLFLEVYLLISWYIFSVIHYILSK